MSSLLHGRVAIVTGAAAGQGRAVAVRFAEEGAALAICDVDAAGLAETAARVERVGGRVVSSVVDMADISAVRAFVALSADRLDGIDIVYNNAGISKSRSIEEHDEEFWDHLQAVNLKGPFFLIQAALPHLRESEHAVIINVSSMAGVTGLANLTAYCASKGGLNQLTRALAVELATEGIRVNAIAPGLIQTDLIDVTLKDLSPEEKSEVIKGWAQRQLFKRAGQPSEIASIAAFLASDEASFITGEIINGSAGWSAA